MKILRLLAVAAVGFAQTAPQIPSSTELGQTRVAINTALGKIATIACVGTPGSTAGSYGQECQTAAGGRYACNNASGCALPEDWVAVAASGTYAGVGNCTSGQYETGTATGTTQPCAQVAYGQISGTPTLGTAASHAATDFQTAISGAPSTWPTLGTAASHAATDFQTAISGAPSTWPTLGTAASHAATDFQVPITSYSTISGLSGYPATFPPPAAAASSLGGVNSKDCSGTGAIQKINTDGTITCGAVGGSTRTWSFPFQGIVQAGVAGFSASLPASSAPVATNVGGTDPASVLEWPTGQSTYYAWWAFDLPAGYVSNSAISYSITSRSTDSTHAAILTPSWGCVATATVDAPTWTGVTPINITGAATSGRVVTTGTITPTCAAANRALVKFAVNTSTNSMTAGFDLISVIFSVQGGM